MIRAIGGITRKWVSPGHDGVPDRVVIYQGTVWFVEVKTVDGRLESWQCREHQRLVSAGANVITTYGEQGVKSFVAQLMKHTNKGEG